MYIDHKYGFTFNQDYLECFFNTLIKLNNKIEQVRDRMFLILKLWTLPIIKIDLNYSRKLITFQKILTFIFCTFFVMSLNIYNWLWTILCSLETISDKNWFGAKLTKYVPTHCTSIVHQSSITLYLVTRS